MSYGNGEKVERSQKTEAKGKMFCRSFILLDVASSARKMRENLWASAFLKMTIHRRVSFRLPWACQIKEVFRPHSIIFIKFSRSIYCRRRRLQLIPLRRGHNHRVHSKLAPARYPMGRDEVSNIKINYLCCSFSSTLFIPIGMVNL